MPKDVDVLQYLFSLVYSTKYTNYTARQNARTPLIFSYLSKTMIPRKTLYIVLYPQDSHCSCCFPEMALVCVKNKSDKMIEHENKILFNFNNPYTFPFFSVTSNTLSGSDSYDNYKKFRFSALRFT